MCAQVCKKHRDVKKAEIEDGFFSNKDPSSTIGFDTLFHANFNSIPVDSYFFLFTTASVMSLANSQSKSCERENKNYNESMDE